MHLALKMKEEAAPTLGRVEFLPLLHAGRVHRHLLLRHTGSVILRERLTALTNGFIVSVYNVSACEAVRGPAGSLISIPM